jgi:hypothetical protein
MSRISTQARDPSAPLESVLDLMLADLGAAADLHDVVARAHRSGAGRSGARRSRAPGIRADPFVFAGAAPVT